jgi:hypothetical protein
MSLRNQPQPRGSSASAPISGTRAVAARAPFYDERFGIGLSAREKADLVAFLRAR